VFDPIKTLAEKSPALSKHVPAAEPHLHPKSGRTSQSCPRSPTLQHGANLHGGVIDELHVHKTPDLVEAHRDRHRLAASSRSS
jgi:hypothetical protein